MNRPPGGRHDDPERRRKEVPTIGILAGMGPRATAPFVDMVVTECQEQYGARHDLDFPPMMIYSLPTPFRLDRPLDHDAMRSTIRRGLQELEATGVDLIAMPCNTAHVYHDELAESVAVPLLDMVDEAVNRIPDGVSTMAVVATRATMESGLYEDALEGEGIRPRAPSRERIDELIARVKAGPPGSGRDAWCQLLDDLRDGGADALLVACTDLSVLAGSIRHALPIVDASRTLATALVARWRALRADL